MTLAINTRGRSHGAFRTQAALIIIIRSSERDDCRAPLKEIRSRDLNHLVCSERTGRRAEGSAEDLVGKLLIVLYPGRESSIALRVKWIVDKIVESIIITGIV